uniref:Uncharacterized protein n=1 Tax=Acrobeloides nanus TaxID=290746 RepID=A0A914EAQ4_9BILA
MDRRQQNQCNSCDSCNPCNPSSGQQFQSSGLGQTQGFNQSQANSQRVPINGGGQPTGQAFTGGSENLSIYSQQAGYYDQGQGQSIL